MRLFYKNKTAITIPAILFITIILTSIYTKTAAEKLTEKYGSVPKGVILEGQASGFSAVKTLKYDIDKNRFILNKTEIYPVPVSREVLYQVLMALSRDDRIGVSLTAGNREIVYGALDPQGKTAKALLNADKILVSIIFGWTKNLSGIKLPGKYQPKSPAKRKLAAICINKFYDYRFSKRKNVYFRSELKMANMLYPMSSKRASDGGYLAGSGSFEPTDVENLNELRQNSSEYLKVSQIADAAAIGEIAAFARFLRDDGNLDLVRLARHVMR